MTSSFSSTAFAVLGRQVAQGAVEQQHGQAVHGRPAGDLGSDPAFGGDGPGRDELVEHLAEQDVGGGVLLERRVVGIGRAERDGEQPRLGSANSTYARPTSRSRARARCRGRCRSTPSSRRASPARAGHPDDGDLGEQLVTVGEVPVGRVVRDAGTPRHLAQHDAVGTLGARQLDRRRR